MCSSLVILVFFVILLGLLVQQIPIIVAFWRGHSARWRICTLSLYCTT